MANESGSAHEQRQATYSGHVQGVGFRYTVSTIARGWRVTGYVRNLADGRVEVVAEGASDQLDGFLDEIADRMQGLVRDVRIACSPAGNAYADFGIRF